MLRSEFIPETESDECGECENCEDHGQLQEHRNGEWLCAKAEGGHGYSGGWSGHESADLGGW